MPSENRLCGTPLGIAFSWHGTSCDVRCPGETISHGTFGHSDISIGCIDTAVTNDTASAV